MSLTRSHKSEGSSIYEPPRDKSNKMSVRLARLRSAWVSAQSDQCLRCPYEETLGP